MAWELTFEMAVRMEERSVGFRRCCSSSWLVRVKMNSEPLFSNVHIVVFLMCPFEIECFLSCEENEGSGRCFWCSC